MRVLVLGGTGFVGSSISSHLSSLSDVEIRVAARHRKAMNGAEFSAIDATDAMSLKSAFSNVDVVVNCVTGSAGTIRKNANAIVEAARAAERSIHIIHMISMAVYGSQQGVMSEATPVSDDGNWYGKAKIDAEDILGRYDEEVGSTTILRIGCVYGPRSKLWEGRVGLMIRCGRLGDLGELADGWSNLVHVRDVAKAVSFSIGIPEPRTRTYNLSAPDSPRWNSYFKDFSIGLTCVPLKYKTPLAMTIESNLIAPPLKFLERMSDRGWINATGIQIIPPSLLKLWSQQIKLDSSTIEKELGLQWTSYREGLTESVDYFRRKYGH